jgi:hypothetical protein
VTDADVLERMLAKASGKLAAARRALAARDWDDASSRAYYAAFHAVAVHVGVLRLAGAVGPRLGQPRLRRAEARGAACVGQRLRRQRGAPGHEPVHRYREPTCELHRVIAMVPALVRARASVRPAACVAAGRHAR